MDPMTAAAAATAAGSLWGAYNSNQTNQSNTAAQQNQLNLLNQRQGQVTQAVGQYIQPGQNPYSAMLMQMLAGARAPGGQAVQGQRMMPPVNTLPAAGQPGGPGFRVPGSQPGFAPSAIAGGATAVGPTAPTPAPVPSQPLIDQFGQQEQTYGPGTAATAAYQASQFGQGQMNSSTAQQLAAMGGSAAAGAADMQNGYNLWETQDQLNARRGLTINPATGAWDDPSTRLVNTGDTSYNYYNGQQTSQSLNGGPLTDPSGGQLPAGVNQFGLTQQVGGGQAQPMMTPQTLMIPQTTSSAPMQIPTGPSRAVVAGDPFEGSIPGSPDAPGSPAISSPGYTPPVQNYGSIPGPTGYSLPDLQSFQAPGQLTPGYYNPSMAALPPGVQAQMMQAGSVGQIPQVNPILAQASIQNLPGQVQSSQINSPMIDLGSFSGGTPGFNQGQDALLQMMRAGPQFGMDRGVQQAQNNVLGGAGNPFDTTNLFSALDQKNQLDLNKQVADLQGSFGSFGQRLGTGAMNAESSLRSNTLINQNAQRQQLAMQSYTDAQNRQLQAMGIGAGREQAMNQNILGGYTAQGNLAQAAGGQGLDQLRLLAGLAQGNQQTGMQGQLANQSSGLQAQLANQAAGIQVGGQNQSSQNQISLANLSAMMQAQQANQQAGLSGGQSNLAAFMQAQSGNQNAALQAQLANQAQAGQYGLANQSAVNQGQQFNIGNNMAAQQFNTQQQQAWNQFMMGGLTQANSMQQAQSGQNMGLLSLLAGLPMGQAPVSQPSAMPGAVGDLGQMALMMQLLNRR